MKNAFRCLKSRKRSSATKALLSTVWLAVSIVTVLSIGCGDNGDDPTGTGTTGGSQTTGGTSVANSGSGACPAGQQGCACYDNGTCDSGLVCSANLCVSNTGTGGSGDTCPAGQQGCACYGNGTCNAGLVCSSNQCTQDTSSSGAGGTSGVSGTGGAGTTGGTGVESGSGGSSCTPVEQANACTGRRCGNDPVCGVLCGTCTGEDVCVDGQCTTPCVEIDCGTDPVTQVDCGGCSTGTCCDGKCVDTSTDRENCGSCGNECAAPYGDSDNGASSCDNGQCTPYYSPCFTEDDGFINCNEICSSIGEICSDGGCDSVNWPGWGALDLDECERLISASGGGDGPCNEPIAWEGNSRIIRCCCTDTQ